MDHGPSNGNIVVKLMYDELQGVRKELREVSELLTTVNTRLNGLRCSEHNLTLNEIRSGKYAKQKDLEELAKLVHTKIHWTAFWVALIPSLTSIVVALLISQGGLSWQ